MRMDNLLEKREMNAAETLRWKIALAMGYRILQAGPDGKWIATSEDSKGVRPVPDWPGNDTNANDLIRLECGRGMNFNFTCDQLGGNRIIYKFVFYTGNTRFSGEDGDLRFAICKAWLKMMEE